MPLIRGNREVVDGWQRLDGEASLPAAGPIILDLRRLEEEAETLYHRPGGLGVELLPAERVERIEPWLDRLELIALRFPAFVDGRAYSTARLLRERMGYKGELRATGNVLIDQHQPMLRCGFDSFEVAPGRAWESWRNAKVWMDLAYAPGYAETLPTRALSIMEARHGARLAATA
jgi:uncharacterized protein (DUF934 family)